VAPRFGRIIVLTDFYETGLTQAASGLVDSVVRARRAVDKPAEVDSGRGVLMGHASIMDRRQPS